MTSPTPPPGWYPDPQRVEIKRYWDGNQWTDQVDQPKKKTGNWKWIAGLAVVLIAIFVVANIAGGDSKKDGDDDTASVPVSTISREELRETEAAQSSRAAEQSAMKAAAAAERARQQDKSQYKALTERDWQLIAKDPMGHLGEKVVVYGEVTQADSITGAEIIRVSTGGQPADYYTINTVATEGTPGIFKQVVEDDLVTMYARVDGVKEYKTTLGGETTAPELKVYVIETTG